VVQVPTTDAQGRPATPREVEVTTGLSDGTLTEILSGLNEGDQVIALPDSGAPRQAGGGLPGF
jgi:multidrug efflux pump subunit AcrA (membrane-fusion protein)